MQCKFGLFIYQTPIIANHTILGYLSCGYGKFSDTRSDEFTQKMNPSMQAAYREISVISRNRLTSVSETLALISTAFIRLMINHIKEEEISRYKISLTEEKERQMHLTEVLRQTQLKFLESQVNPHFLFNTLNTIAQQAVLDGADKIASLTYALSNLLRLSLGKEKSLVTIDEEIHYIKDYLYIQQTRFPDKFLFECQIEPELKKINIPLMTLMVLVENAILHGFKNISYKGVLRITGRIKMQYAVIEVIDNGCGVPKDIIETIRMFPKMDYSQITLKGLGIKNIFLRLRHYYDNNFRFFLFHPLWRRNAGADNFSIREYRDGKEVTNMYLMIVADDEYLVCQYIRHIVKKNHLPIVICGEASNGEDAVQLAYKYQPNFAILDINMPGLNGLEAAKRIRKQNSDMIIYILTAYQQFDYVYDAMQAAVTDYLVKPIKPNELVKVLKKGIEKALRQRLNNIKKEKIDMKLKQRESIVMQQKVIELLKLGGSNVQLLRLFRYISQRNTFTPIALVCLAYWKNTGESMNIFDRQIGNMYRYAFQKYAIGIQYDDVFILIFDVWNSTIRNKLRKNINVCESTHNIKISASLVMVDKVSVGHACKQAVKRCKANVFWKNTQQCLCIENKEVDEAVIQFYQIYQKLNECISEYSINKAIRLIHSLFREMKQVSYLPELTCAHIIRLGCELLGKYGLPGRSPICATELEREFIETVQLAVQYEEVQTSIIRLISAIIGNSSALKNNAQQIVRRAVAYINTHYDNEITLESIAKETFVSTAYLSRVFKKYMGKGYASYLNEVRMKKAKELLYSNQYTVTEVARLVGFKDASYFSSVFKKYYRYSPTEFLLQRRQK